MQAILRERSAAYAHEPVYDTQIAVCVRCWHQVSTCRAIGMAVGPMPWDAVAEWCDREGLDDDARQIMHAVIEHCDGARAEREAAKTNMPETGKGTRPRR